MIQPADASLVAAPPPSAAEANAAVLGWQLPLRIGFALLCGTLLAAAVAAGIAPAVSPLAASTIVCYLVAVTALSLAARSSGAASSAMLAATVGADVLLVFGITYLAVPPQYYDRTLLFAFAILHLTEFHFGRGAAAVALVTVVFAYLGMVGHALAHGAPLLLGQELLTLGVFALAGGAFVVHYGTFKRRLSDIALLFGKAEQGDFSTPYAVERDGRPDDITMVGRAYNRMREQLAALVLTDMLSGCLNRRGFEQELRREVARAVRSGRELAVVVLDVDRFKDINDSLGHLAGDVVIREVGAMLREVARTGDLVARWGGDEFALLLPDTPAVGAERLAQRVTDAMRQRRFPGVDPRHRITLSIGLAAEKVVDESAGMSLHARADEALYHAKETGRDRWSVWTPGIRNGRRLEVVGR